MSFLDMYAGNQAEALRIKPNESPNLPATFGDTFDAAWSENQLFGQSIARENARSAALQDHIDAVKSRTGKDISSKVNWDDVVPGAEVLSYKPVSAMLDDINAEAEKNGLPTLSIDDLEERALLKSKAARSDFEDMRKREKTFGGSVGMFVGGAASSATDPINLLALPIAPETVGVGIFAAAMRWGVVGAGAQLGIEIAGGRYRETAEPGYSASGQPLVNVAEAFGGGAVLGGGTKALGNLWTRMKSGAWPTSVRDAGNVLESEANVANTNVYPGVEGEVAHRSVLQDSIDQLVTGRPVDVDQHITPSILAAYEKRLAPVMESRAAALTAQESAFSLEREGARLPPTMERLTEQQLGGFREAAEQARAEAGTITSELTARRQEAEAVGATLTERTQALEAKRADIERLKSEVDAAQQRAAAVPQHIDEATKGRLDAIEADLAKKNLSDLDRARLEGERQSITESIAAGPSEAELSRQRGSHLQEAAGLTKTLAAEQKALAKAEARLARDTEGLTSKQAAATRQAEALPGRTAARIEAAQAGLRKTINKLAHDGYGVRLTKDEAAALAEGVISAPDGNAADQAIRTITETLVDRRLARRGKAPELPFGETNPVAQKAAEAGYHTDQMRKQIQGLSREVGYEMPREEATVLAAKIAGMLEHEALAVLDELMLRPRTITETLPGIGGAKALIQDVEATLGHADSEAVASSKAALANDLTPEAVAKIAKDPVLDDTVLRDLDRLRAEKGDVEVPMGETINANGERMAMTRKVEDVLAEADERLAAAKEIEACAGPQQEAAE